MNRSETSDIIQRIADEPSKKVNVYSTKNEVLENYKIWVLTRLYYSELDKQETDLFDNKYYVEYETLEKTPCSSMFKIPLRKNDLDTALLEMFNDNLIESITVSNNTIDHVSDKSDSLKNLFNHYSPIESKILFRLTVDGNLRLLYQLNQVLKYDDYETARKKLDVSNVTLHQFLDDILKHISDYKWNTTQLRKMSIEFFINNFQSMLNLKELLND